MDKGQDDLAEAFEELLEAERAALLDGDIDRLEILKTRKADLLGALADNSAGLARETAHRLRDKAERNQVLLESAGRGIAAVRQRILEIRDAASGAGNYDSSGKRSRPASANKLEKRA